MGKYMPTLALAAKVLLVIVVDKKVGISDMIAARLPF